MKNCSHRKNIALHPYPPMLLHSNDLRSHVSRSAAPIEDIGLVLSENGQPEINNNRITFALSEHDVLHFDVAVGNSKLMQVFQTLENSPHYILYLSDVETLVKTDLLSQSASYQPFTDEVNGCL